MPNLLTAPVLSVGNDRKLSLPGLLAAMARGDVSGFPALRPHQRAAWHMFLVQLAVLALDAAERDDLPEDEEGWAAALRGVTPDWPGDEPWRLVVEDPAAPAFLQPPDPGGLKWEQSVTTPDALDMLITSRNHDLKRQVARGAAPEDWIFSLVSLQTQKPYDVQYHGTVRPKSGAASRAMFSVAPAEEYDGNSRCRLSAWWRRDTEIVLSARNNERKPSGPHLLWTEPWPQGGQLYTHEVDPLFIEVTTRVRLKEKHSTLHACLEPSKPSRIKRENLSLLTEPWSPASKADGTPFNLWTRDLDYRTLYDVLFSGEYSLPICLGSDDVELMGGHVLIAEAISMEKQSKTDGLKSRAIPVPRAVGRSLFSRTAADLASSQVAEIEDFSDALTIAVARFSAGGPASEKRNGKFVWVKPNGTGLGWREIQKHYDRAATAVKSFDRQANTLFFPSLWARLAAAEADYPSGEERQAGEDDATWAFLDDLRAAAEAEFEAALHGIPCATVLRPQAEVRARRAFWGHLACKKKLRRQEAEDDAA